MAIGEKIRVAHVVTRMNVGGVAVLIDNLHANYDKSRFEFTLITGACQMPERDYLDGKNLNYRIVHISSLMKSTGLGGTWEAFISIYRTLKSIQPHIVHTHTSKAGVLGRVASLLVNPRTIRIHTFHGHLLVGYFHKFKVRLITIIEKTLGLITDSFISMGSQVKADLVNAGIAKDEKFRVVMPGLKMPTQTNKLEAQEALGLSTQELYCTFIGRLTQVKRPDRLLEVARISRDAGSKIRYLVVGDGDLLQSLSNEVNFHNLPVTFLGWREDIDLVLSASDVLILTSDNEAVALTLIEASQLGIPIVTTSAGSVRDIARDGSNGFVTGFNAQELFQAVFKLENSSELRASMGDNGKAIAQDLFSISRMVADHESLYLESLKSL